MKKKSRIRGKQEKHVSYLFLLLLKREKIKIFNLYLYFV